MLTNQTDENMNINPYFHYQPEDSQQDKDSYVILNNTLSLFVGNKFWFEKHIVKNIYKKGAYMLKKTILKIALMFLTWAVALQASETKVAGEIWNRYMMRRKDDETILSQFSFDRGYLTLEPVLSDKIKGRFTLDFFSSDKYNDGAGIKVKYGYLDFAQLVPIKESNLQIGLVKNYFGLVYDWAYPVIEKSLEDKEKVMASVDYGAVFTGYLPNGFGEYAVGLYNGEGYTKTQSKVNTNFAPLFNLRLTPLAGFTIGGSVVLDKPGFTGLISGRTSGSGNTLRAESTWKKVFDNRTAYAGITKLAFGPVEILAEYLINHYDSTRTKKIDYADTLRQDSLIETKYAHKGRGYSITPIISLQTLIGFDSELVLRYDFWDGNTDIKDYKSAFNTIFVGVNYNILRNPSAVPVLTLQVNWQRKTFKKEDATITEVKKPEDQIGLQLKWRYSSTIK